MVFTYTDISTRICCGWFFHVLKILWKFEKKLCRDDVLAGGQENLRDLNSEGSHNHKWTKFQETKPKVTQTKQPKM